MCTILIFVWAILFILKKYNIVNVFYNIVKMHTNKYQLYQKYANNNLGHNKHP